jgi:hypothetical protein
MIEDHFVYPGCLAFHNDIRAALDVTCTSLIRLETRWTVANEVGVMITTGPIIVISVIEDAKAYAMPWLFIVTPELVGWNWMYAHDTWEVWEPALV